MAKILSIQNPKGGVGKSFLVRLLVGYCLKMGIKFKVIDMGSQLTCFNLAKRENHPLLKGLIIPLVTDNQATFLSNLDLLEDEELIIIDSNANITKEEINMVSAMSDVIIVPVVASMGDLDATMVFSRFMQVAKEEGVIVRTLINKFDDTLENKEIREVCINALKLKPLDTVLRNKPATYRRWEFAKEPDRTVDLLGKEILNLLEL